MYASILTLTTQTMCHVSGCTNKNSTTKHYHAKHGEPTYVWAQKCKCASLMAPILVQFKSMFLANSIKSREGDGMFQEKRPSRHQGIIIVFACPKGTTIQTILYFLM